jgi:hypothetical protein
MLNIWNKEDSDFFLNVVFVHYFHNKKIENFLRNVIGREKLPVTGEEGRKTVAIFELIYRV